MINSGHDARTRAVVEWMARRKHASYDDSQVRSDVMRLEQQIAALTMKLDQMIAVLNQHEADIGQTRHELAGHTHESLTRRVA